MQITIGEYTTRNGCVAKVTEHYHSTGLLAGVVILPGCLTQAYVWWNPDGAVNMPLWRWSHKEVYGTHYFQCQSGATFEYSYETYIKLTANQSLFDITEPKQMKEETKPVIVQTHRLIKLPSGDWIDPKTVTLIRAVDRIEAINTGRLRCDHIEVAAGGRRLVAECESFEQAQKIADDLAEKVNSIK